MSEDVKTCQQDCFKNLQYFSGVIDESTDITDTAHLAVFVRAATSNFNIVKYFVELFPIKGTTTGKDILKALMYCIDDMRLNFLKLVSVITDGATAIIGKRKSKNSCRSGSNATVTEKEHTKC